MMAEGRSKLEWGLTSSLMALIVNVLRDPRHGKPAKPEDFNPYYQKKKSMVKITMTQLRKMFPNPGEMAGNYGRSKQ